MKANEMREIIFRAKELKNCKWRYGNLHIVERGSQCHIVDFGNIYPIEEKDTTIQYGGVLNWWEVEPETVGQFTGLKDINGVEIYEGDIIKQQNFNGEEYTAIYQVCYDLGSFCLQLVKGNAKAMKDSGYSSWSFELYAEDKGKIRKGQVIGNIHDNPEILK